MGLGVHEIHKNSTSSSPLNQLTLVSDTANRSLERNFLPHPEQPFLAPGRIESVSLLHVVFLPLAIISSPPPHGQQSRYTDHADHEEKFKNAID